MIIASWQPDVTMIDSSGTLMPSSISSIRAIIGPSWPLVRPYCRTACRTRASLIAPAAQVSDVRGQVALDVGDVIELIEWPAGGQRNRRRKTAGDFIEEIHRRRHRVGNRRVQRIARYFNH